MFPLPAFRAWRRRMTLGLPTIFGLARRGFFIPYRYADSLPPAGELQAYGPVEDQLDACRAQMSFWFDAIDGFAADLEKIGDRPPPAPRWNQDWFPRADAAIAYTITRTINPARIVEIGCGHSTRFFARAADDGGLDTRITAIDPAPRADLAGIERVDLHQTTLQGAGEAPFGALAAGDILAIDSSHILMPGTDVDMLLNRILPSLPAGVYVHIHDIFLPDPYPTNWEWRGYNEQQGVAPMITGGGWTVEFASHYAVSRMADRVTNGVLGRLPLQPGAKEASLWLKKG
jgi:hypothetical protein